MWQAAFTLTLGFVLTVLIGGAYASYLQRRSWQHQNQSRLDEEERKQATEISTTLSELIDKRHYRLYRMLQAIVARARGEVPDGELQDRYSDYEKSLADWNDQLTTRRLSVKMYFGEDVGVRLERIIDGFREASDAVETLYRQAATALATVEGSPDVATTEKRLEALRANAYELGLTMMLLIRAGEIGRTAPLPSQPPPEQPLATALTGGGLEQVWTLHRSDMGRWTLYPPEGEAVPVEGLEFVPGRKTRSARELAAEAIFQLTGAQVEGWDEDYDGDGNLQYYVR